MAVRFPTIPNLLAPTKDKIPGLATDCDKLVTLGKVYAAEGCIRSVRADREIKGLKAEVQRRCYGWTYLGGQ